MQGQSFWLSGCKDFGIVETHDGTFDIYYRLFSTLSNHDAEWFPNYESARKYLKDEHFMETRLKKVSKEEFESVK